MIKRVKSKIWENKSVIYSSSVVPWPTSTPLASTRDFESTKTFLTCRWRKKPLQASCFSGSQEKPTLLVFHWLEQSNLQLVFIKAITSKPNPFSSSKAWTVFQRSRENWNLITLLKTNGNLSNVSVRTMKQVANSQVFIMLLKSSLQVLYLLSILGALYILSLFNSDRWESSKYPLWERGKMINLLTSFHTTGVL